MGRVEKIDYLAPYSLKIRNLPEIKKPRCPKGQCYSVIVHIDKDGAEWRCVKCLNYTSVDLQRAGQGSLF